jgi:hypothetical protein
MPAYARLQKSSRFRNSYLCIGRQLVVHESTSERCHFKYGRAVELVVSSVTDPDPNPDPRVFGPPGSGSGSISQRYGSGSGSGSFYH